jgi:hypothetical protein
MSDTWGLFTASIIADRFTNLLCLTGVLIERRVCCPQCSSPSFSGEWQQPKQLQTELQDNQRRQCYKCEADVEIDYLIQPRLHFQSLTWPDQGCSRKKACRMHQIRYLRFYSDKGIWLKYHQCVLTFQLLRIAGWKYVNLQEVKLSFRN